MWTERRSKVGGSHPHLGRHDPSFEYQVLPFYRFVVICFYSIELLDDQNIYSSSQSRIFFCRLTSTNPPQALSTTVSSPVQEVKEQTQTALKKQFTKKLDVSQQFSPLPELKDRCGAVDCSL